MDVVSLAQELVKTPSLSGEEEKVAHIIKDILSETVDTVTIDTYGNIIAEITGTGTSAVMLEGHMDHVPPGTLDHWVYPPYSAKIVDNVLYGRGAVDMKGSLASMMTAVQTLAEKERETTVYAAFVVHEETIEGVAIHKVMETLPYTPDLVVLGEPSHLNIAVGHRGRCLLAVDLTGKTAHASMPDRGINTIEAAAYLVDHLKLVFPEHPLLKKATITPIDIECTPKGLPQLPDRCELIFDRRLLIDETEKEIINEVDAILKEMKLKNKITEGTVSIVEEARQCWTGAFLETRDFFPAWITPDKQIVPIKKALPHNPQTVIWEFSTDGVYTAGKAKIPTIGFGPGDWHCAHQPNEGVSLKELEKAVEGYVTIVESE
jgi:putative selenium metabolism hydrolase